MPDLCKIRQRMYGWVRYRTVALLRLHSSKRDRDTHIKIITIQGWLLGVLWEPVSGEMVSFWAPQWELLKEMDLGGWAPLKVGLTVPQGVFRLRAQAAAGGMQTAGCRSHSVEDCGALTMHVAHFYMLCMYNFI